MCWPIGHESGRLCGFRAVALVLVLSLLMSFGWSAAHAAVDLPALPGAGDGRGGVGTPTLTAGGMVLRDVCLPRQPGVETSRQALPAPPDPQPVSILDILLPAPSPARRGQVSGRIMPFRPAHRLPRGPRIPTGPPAA